MNTLSIDMITVLGPTATGKTGFAASLAVQLNGEIISADSRQVYKEMNLGTGKDYEDYKVDGRQVPYHLVDIVEPGSEYNVYQFQKDFLNAYSDILDRGKTPVLCGGTGMYLEAILNGYTLIQVPVNEKLRSALETKSTEELADMLRELRPVHNTTDSIHRMRTIRAIEIETHNRENPPPENTFPEINTEIFGLKFERKVIRERITKRLKERLEAGMIDEVIALLKKGIHPDKLKFYGLEYKFLTMHVLGELSYNDMFQKLNSAIHQFAKRQDTWFRRMERNRIDINWIDGNLPMTEKVEVALGILETTAIGQ
jgi:tRNA dimethylallyltransferase